LIEEREKYGVNDMKPGITGWAQINGRDSLEIEEKVRFDSDYTIAINQGGLKGFAMDAKCMVGTVTAVLKRTGVVEGGTGEIKRQEAEKEEVTSVK
jgi:lipopolysaccharide/colanic/teichoic acid biosynthesis glycosyltransferase